MTFIFSKVWYDVGRGRDTICNANNYFIRKRWSSSIVPKWSDQMSHASGYSMEYSNITLYVCISISNNKWKDLHTKKLCFDMDFVFQNIVAKVWEL